MEVSASAMLAGRHIVVMGRTGVGKSTLLNSVIGSSHFATSAAQARKDVPWNHFHTIWSPVTLTIDGVTYTDIPDSSKNAYEAYKFLNSGGTLTIVLVVELRQGKLSVQDAKLLTRLFDDAEGGGIDLHARITVIANMCHPLVLQAHEADPAAWVHTILPVNLADRVSHAVPLPLLQTDDSGGASVLHDVRGTLLQFLAAAPDLVLPENNILWRERRKGRSASASYSDAGSKVGSTDGGPGGGSSHHLEGWDERSDHPGSSSTAASTEVQVPAPASTPGLPQAPDKSSGDSPTWKQEILLGVHGGAEDVIALPNGEPSISVEPSIAPSTSSKESSKSAADDERTVARIRQVSRFPHEYVISLPEQFVLRAPPPPPSRVSRMLGRMKFWSTEESSKEKTKEPKPKEQESARERAERLRSVYQAERQASSSSSSDVVQQAVTGANSGPPTEPEGQPLADELALVLCGDKTPKDTLVLIDRDTTSASLAEWHAAHQLLMLAVEDGDLSRSPHRSEAALFWWTTRLYGVASTFSYGCEAERQFVAACLLEAQSVGVLENAEGVIVGMVVSENLQNDLAKFERVGLQTWAHVLDVKRETEGLKAAFEKYRRTQRNSQLLGIALHLIPIVGGAVAGVASAGAEVVSGLSVKDIVDSLFDVGAGLKENEIGSTIRQKLFRKAEVAVSESVLDSVPKERKDELKSTISGAGMGIVELRTLLASRSEARGAPNSEEAEDIASATAADGSTVNGPKVAKLPSSFRKIQVRKRMVVGMDCDSLSSFWAAFVIMFDDQRGDEYEQIRAAISEFLEVQQLHPLDVVNAGEMGNVVLNGVIQKLTGKDTSMLLGTHIRLKRFMSLITKP